jgi:hypothetical protein
MYGPRAGVSVRSRSTKLAFALKATGRTYMRQRSPGLIIGLVVALILGFGIIAGIWLALQSSEGLGYEPGVLRATKTGPNSATLSLSTFPDSHVCHGDMGEPQIDWVTYCPTTSLEVPANSTITVVINNYDSATSLINDYFRQVHGTVGGIMLVNNKPMTEVSADAPGHTFTLQSPPNSPYPLFVSVPLLGVANNAPTPVVINGNNYPKPNTISFQFHTGPPGSYIWHCYDPCGDTVYSRSAPYGFSGPMGTTGYMAGTLTVSHY